MQDHLIIVGSIRIVISACPLLHLVAQQNRHKWAFGIKKETKSALHRVCDYNHGRVYQKHILTIPSPPSPPRPPRPEHW